jgi:hypothetical protein
MGKVDKKMGPEIAGVAPLQGCTPCAAQKVDDAEIATGADSAGWNIGRN